VITAIVTGFAPVSGFWWKGSEPMGRLVFVLILAAAARSASAQYQASTIRISRNAHDLAWAATGSAVTFTLKELGVRPRSAALLGGVGVVTVATAVKCVKWCGRLNIDWPASIVLKDAVYDMTLASSSVPILIAKKKGWKAGAVAGVAWLGTVLVLRQARWNSP
jgi:hypothetical protein